MRFYPELACPGNYPLTCMCTLDEPCDAEQAVGAATGICTGRCRQAVSGECPGNATCLADGGACAPPPPYKTFTFILQNQGFTGHPGALVYVPSTFNAQVPNISLVVFIHGFHNCIENVVLPGASGCNCSSDGAYDSAYGLIDSFEAAATAGTAEGSAVSQSLLVAIEVTYDEASSDPGRWAVPGLFAAFVTELLSSDHIGQVIGPRNLSNVNRVRMFSHSGGYNVIGDLATVGGVAAAIELTLLDSLYGDIEAFDSFVQKHIDAKSFGVGAAQARFHSVYTDYGGTEGNNRAMAARVQQWLSAANQSGLMYYDDTCPRHSWLLTPLCSSGPTQLTTIRVAYFFENCC